MEFCKNCVLFKDAFAFTSSILRCRWTYNNQVLNRKTLGLCIIVIKTHIKLILLEIFIFMKYLLTLEREMKIDLPSIKLGAWVGFPGSLLSLSNYLEQSRYNKILKYKLYLKFVTTHIWKVSFSFKQYCEGNSSLDTWKIKWRIMLIFFSAFNGKRFKFGKCILRIMVQ